MRCSSYFDQLIASEKHLQFASYFRAKIGVFSNQIPPRDLMLARELTPEFLIRKTHISHSVSLFFV